jgi:uncharacterized membrane protein
MKTWHKVGFIVSGVFALVSVALAAYFWTKLPASIPTHFGFNGQPDAWNNKSVFYVFLIPVLQIILFFSFVFLYYKPQYSDMPTTLWLMTMEPHKRDHAFELIRIMIAGISIWIGALFTYITYAMNQAALRGGGPNLWIMFGLIGGMIVWLVWWILKVYHATKEVMGNIK